MSKLALRFNEGKPKLSYFIRSFPIVVHSIARIKEFGANKYEEDNWRSGGKPDMEYWDSFFRHLDLFLEGEFYDQDSGCAHLGHMIWNLCALFQLNYKDRPVIDSDLFWDRMEYWRNIRMVRKAAEQVEVEAQDTDKKTSPMVSSPMKLSKVTFGGQGLELIQ